MSKIKIKKNDIKKIEKKGPGRPKKYKEPPPIELLGIQNEPLYKDRNMELIYCNPLTMKKLFSFFVGQSETVQCKFKKDRIDMLCKDKYNSNIIKITLDGHKMHRYFCDEEFECGLALTYLEPLNKKLGKQYSKFMWFSEEDEKKSKTHIWLKWIYYNKTWNQNNYSLAGQYYKIDDKIFDNYNTNDYPISFTLKNKIFKDIIGDAGNHHGLHIYILQEGRDGPLKIEYSPPSLRFGSSNTFENHKEINLVSTLEEDELFSVAINIEFLKPISSIIPTEKINFRVSKTKPLIMIAYLEDKAITIYILTKIVSENINIK